MNESLGLLVCPSGVCRPIHRVYLEACPLPCAPLILRSPSGLDGARR